MRYLIIAILIFIGTSTQINKSIQQQASTKTIELRDMQLNSQDGLIQMTLEQYQYYSMEFPRPYDIVFYFTAPNCRLCEEMYLEYVKAARFYKEDGASYGSKDSTGSKRATFFALMKYTEANKLIFQALGFYSVPNIFVSQPKIVSVPLDEQKDYLKNFKWTISHTDGSVTSHKLLEFINKRTGRNIQYKPSFTDILTMVSILIGSIVTVILAFYGLKPIFNNPTVWLVGSLIIYTTCIAGFVYNIIHNVPFTSTNKHGQLEWKQSGSRQQLGAEGFVMSTCITFVGITMILFHKLLKVKQLQKNQTILTGVYLALFLVLMMLIKFIEGVYKEKSWYGPQFWPPAHYIKGPLMNDQGNSI